MHRKLLFLIILLAFAGLTNIHSQGIKGKVVDSEGNPVGYASIFIKELSRGTTTNPLGSFSLPLPEGEYHIFFRSLGYTEVYRTVNVSGEMLTLNITLPPQTYMIPEIRISASGEDPAYRVMRKAIGLANYHLNQVSFYNAEVYIKGTAYFHKLPRAIAKRINVADVKVEEGRAYMLESINDVKYYAPDKYDHQVLASQNTIPGYLESVNPMDYVNASLYQPQIEGFVSPLARNAFYYYKFSFEGSFLQGTHMVDKIKVTPKRKSQQLVSGFLYIVEDLWCLHSSDLAVNTLAGTLFLQQQYANVIMDSWLPVSHKLSMAVGFAGVEADVTYVSSLEYKDTHLNANLPKSYFEPSNKPSPKAENKIVSKEQEQINEILEKDELNNRDMSKLTKLMEKESDRADTSSNKLEMTSTKFSIAENALTNDSIFWKDRRPVPLTLEEQQTLTKRDLTHGTGGKDSIKVITTTGPRPVTKKPLKAKDIIMGQQFRPGSKKKTKLIYGGLIDASMFSFNTIDGFCYGQHINYDYRPGGDAIYRWDLKAAYAFSRKAPLLTWTSSILYAPQIRGKIALRANYHSQDFNGLTPIPVLSNEVYSLFLKENYSKRYENISATLEHRMDIATGFVFYATIDVANRRELRNNSDFSLFFKDSKDYSLNVPSDYDPDFEDFNDQNLLAAQVRLEYTHEYHYKLRNKRKQYIKSDYPTIYFQYRHALAVQTGWADYNFLLGGLTHNKEVGLLSELNYRLEAGYFPKNDVLHFADYAHFKSTPLLVGTTDLIQSFSLLDYYRASTKEYHLMGHIEFESPYMLIKMLPWFSERLWQEALSVSYLKNDRVDHHIQLGYTITDIGFLMDIGVFTAFENWDYFGTGLRINMNF